GYWNFGWPGILLVCFASGLVLGITQRLCSRDHWALCAIGVAHVAGLTVAGTAVGLYRSPTQLLLGRLLAVWGVYFVAQQLSGDDRSRSKLAGLARRA